MHAISIFRTAAILSSIAMLAACGKPPANSAYFNRGGPESLLDVSSEVVNLSTANKSDLVDLAGWVEKDHPTRAELNCNTSDKNCTEAQKILDLQGVPSSVNPTNSQSVTLVYERILARDCNPSFVDNSHNYYNTYHPAFGCATAANIIQHVTNKQDFISPNLSDDASATRAVNDIHRAYVPRPVVQPYSVKESLAQTK